nr:mannose-1-phosphate guanylyltransferase [Lachnospiraceae bacterium]
MNIIILSGGSGKRLWPLTGGQRAKQFIKCLKREDGTPESMLQRAYRNITGIYPDARIVVAANSRQTETIRDQIGEKTDISAEPCARDTFAAMALAVLYFSDRFRVDENEAVVVCPSDAYAEKPFYECFKLMSDEVQSAGTDMVLVGRKPDNASSEYGYIMPEQRMNGDLGKFLKVKSFVEKPDTATSLKLVDEGALWNCGVFAFRISNMKRIVKELTGIDNYTQFLDRYASLPSLSF